MSITKEQAATWFATTHPPGPAAREMYRMAAKALRPVSREQVEKEWRGEWTRGEYVCGEHEWKCSKCHETEWRTSCSRLKFCPFCGAPMTEEAVEVVMERLEGMKDETETD